MSVLAVKALLVPIYHRLPIEVTGILDAALVWQFSEVDTGKQCLQVREELFEAPCLIRNGAEE